MSITTKKGDDGKSRFGGRVVEKDSELLETMGTIDELVALLGIAKMKNNSEMGKKIERVIVELRQIMGLISGYETKNVNLDENIKYMDGEIKRMEDEMDTIRGFLESGKRLDEFLNWCRTVVRRCERRVVSLSKTQRTDKNILVYLNRLSDYIYLLALK